MVLTVRCVGLGLGASTVAEEDDELTSLWAVSLSCLKLSLAVQTGGEVDATMGESCASVSELWAMDGGCSVFWTMVGDLCSLRDG